MIERALQTGTGDLVYADKVAAEFEKGDFLCPYCESPMLPVEGRFWRIYPGEEHKFGYCRTISQKEGTVTNPALTKEYTFFSNNRRPEAEFRDAGDDGLSERLMEEMKAGAEFDGSDIEGFLRSICCADPDTDSSAEPAKAGDRKHFERSARTMSDLFFDKFHESRLTTPMFHGVRGDYMVFPENASIYLEEHNGQIMGPRILSAKFTGFSEDTKTLTFSLMRSVNAGTPAEKATIAARIEMTCKDDEYFHKAVLPKFIAPADGNSSMFSYIYRDCRVWLRGNWKWADEKKCGGQCIYRSKHPNHDCGTCAGVARTELKTSAQLLITNWMGHDGKWEKLEPRQTSQRKA